MAGDAGNMFPHAPTNEKVHTVAGEEFRERQGCITEIMQSQYGIVTALRSWLLYLGDFMRSIGCVLTRADLGIWIKKDSNYNGYCYISTHADDFLIIGTDPESVMKAFKDKFEIRNDKINPAMYLGIEWQWTELGKTKVYSKNMLKNLFYR